MVDSRRAYGDTVMILETLTKQTRNWACRVASWTLDSSWGGEVQQANGWRDRGGGKLQQAAQQRA